MNTVDLSPLYRSTIGFDRLASLLDSTLAAENSSSGYPPYNIEACEENVYAITLAVAGFEKDEIEINVENSMLTVRGKKEQEESRQYLHQGIANRAFERKFNLDDHVEVTGADLNNGLLSIHLVKEIPEAMKPRRIKITQDNNSDVIEHQNEDDSENKSEQAA